MTAQPLPVLISVPHAGLAVPPAAQAYCQLAPHEILADGDVGASEIYWALEPRIAALVTTDIARAIIDLNRDVDDRRKDGVIKTHTCWDVPVYTQPLPEEIVRQLIATHHRPYHERLTTLAESGVILGLDGHTMAAVGPPVGPDPGTERPLICLGNGDGTTCPDEWLVDLGCCLERAFGRTVALNTPFAGGYIVRSQARHLPWVQLELSRAPWMAHAEKSAGILHALTEWCRSRSR